MQCRVQLAAAAGRSRGHTRFCRERGRRRERCGARGTGGEEGGGEGRVVQLKGGGVKGKLCEFLTFFHVMLYRRW